MKKYYRFLATVLSVVLVLSTLAACKKDDGGGTAGSGTAGGSSGAPTELTQEALDEVGLELVDGKYRFKEMKEITVEIFDRGQDDGKTTPENNYWTDWIKEGVLEDHNISVTFVAVPRWTESDDINNLLASETAPDVCVTYNIAAVNQYAAMGGVVDISELVYDYKPALMNMYNLLEDFNIWFNQDPETGALYAIETLAANTAQINTYVREDWLAKLNLEEPTTLEEFEDVLIAFRDNAETLLGADADQMIPFALSQDVAWRAYNLLHSFFPDDITDKDLYVYGFDDRGFSMPYIKEGVRILNKWYNEGLIWKDFALYGDGDTTEDQLMKNGYIGAWEQSYDLPYRDGANGITAMMHELIGPDATYIAIEPFLNDAGVPKKYVKGRFDRKIFFPMTNDEPLASLLYVDWISAPENQEFLQIGEEGVHHEVTAEGAIRSLTDKSEKIMNSALNIDYTITINGLTFQNDDEKTNASRALAFPEVDPVYPIRSMEVNANHAFSPAPVNLGTVASEEGMATPLADERDRILAQTIIVPVADFDATWDKEYANYLSMGGQKIIDERTELWEAAYGDSTSRN
ncbi:MAG: sugar ABC transporter substrate-binding protein [Lachnospiraceae bacterium]|jgi:putative aldouronate transport system substrate-binding protein|nr:sugar ABC transporter substrate-binding protein [Lachnospiraceae bacterium]